MKIAANVLIGLAFSALVACQSTPPANRGQSGYRMDPTREAPSELRARSLRSADLVTATDVMAQDIASRLDVNDPVSPPRIIVGDISNRTSAPHQNYQVFLARLRAELMASGARHGLEFIADRDLVEQQRNREYGREAGEGYRSRADYLLTCDVYDMPTGGTRYYLLDYQLVQLRAADSGPDVGPGVIVWENKYEVKFQ